MTPELSLERDLRWLGDPKLPNDESAWIKAPGNEPTGPIAGLAGLARIEGFREIMDGTVL